MKEKVKSLCKEQGITLKELADQIGIARESITRALDGNPRLSTIRGIATALNVQISELFPQSTGSKRNVLNGFVEYQGTIYRIQDVEDLKRLLGLIQGQFT